LAYLEDRAYEQRAGVEAAKVQDFLSKGARPGHKQNGATALQLVVLNPYSSFEELNKVFMMMVSAAPEVAAIQDGFKLTPFMWASDYTNIAQQHGLSRPNPGVLLALVSALMAVLPPEVDAGEYCAKVAPDGQCPMTRPVGAPATRFMEGDRVVCRVQAPGGETAWEEGVVVGMWYREGCWPDAHPGAAYEIRLDIGLQVFAIADNDRLVRREEASGKKSAAPSAPAAAAAAGRSSAAAQAEVAAGEAGGRGGTGDAAAAKPGGQRFQRRRREDGKWELLDTVSGKGRPCSPPDSDEEDG